VHALKVRKMNRGKRGNRAPRRVRTSVAAKLELLLSLPKGARKDPPSLLEVATGTGLSLSYLTMLRGGRRNNPTITTLRRLAAYFHVPTAFFCQDTRVGPTVRRQRQSERGRLRGARVRRLRSRRGPLRGRIRKRGALATA